MHTYSAQNVSYAMRATGSGHQLREVRKCSCLDVIRNCTRYTHYALHQQHEQKGLRRIRHFVALLSIEELVEARHINDLRASELLPLERIYSSALLSGPQSGPSLLFLSPDISTTVCVSALLRGTCSTHSTQGEGSNMHGHLPKHFLSNLTFCTLVRQNTAVKMPLLSP